MERPKQRSNWRYRDDLICFLAGSLFLVSASLLFTSADVRAQQGSEDVMNVLYLDGKRAYVVLPASVEFGKKGATVEAWVQWKSFNAYSRVFDFGKEKNAAFIQNYQTTSTLNFTIYDRRKRKHSLQAPNAVSKDVWYHIAAVCGRGGMKLYINGSLVGKNAHKGSMSDVSGKMNYIGKSNWPSDKPFHGYMTEFRIWDIARTRKDILETMNRQLSGDEEHLVGYWRLDAADGAILKDLTGNGNHATMVNGAIYTVPRPPLETAGPPEAQISSSPPSASPSPSPSPSTSMSAPSPDPLQDILAGSTMEDSRKQKLLVQKERAYKERQRIEGEIRKVESEYQQVSSDHDRVKRDHPNKREAYEKAKDAYTRASQNVDFVSPEQLAELLREYKRADGELKASDDALKKLENERKFIEGKLGRLQGERLEVEIEILEIQAEIYDMKSQEPVWVEGYGESILDEDKTMKQAGKLALDYAKRNALEKGGKAVIESLSKVEMFELVKDEIKISSNIKVVEQDNTGDFGKVKRVIQGDIIKFTAKVRLKVQSVDSYNPYREKIEELQKRRK